MLRKRIDLVLDLKDLKCPHTLLKLKETLEGLEKGQVIKVVAREMTTKTTFPPYLKRTGDTLLSIEENDGELHYHIEKR